MRGAAKYLLAIAAAGGLGAGCDWRDFDTLQGQAPVLRVDPPSGFQSSGNFGNALLPVAPPVDGSTAAWFLASGTETTGLALIKVNAAGSSSGQSLTGTLVDDLYGNPVTAMAEIPGTGTALLGAPTAGSLLTFEMESATLSQFVPASPLGSSEGLFGVGVAAGNLTGSASPDLVVASETSVHVFVDGSTTDVAPGAADLSACPILLSSALPGHDLQRRALVIGNLLGSGPVIAVGTPGAAVAGSVSFFTATASAVTCAGVLTAPPLSPATTVNAGFGTALAIGDFDGDGVPDLLVGAPPAAVYLYKGPLALPAAATATIPPPTSDAVDFGRSLAAMNIDGMAGDEAVIGDPGATVNGQSDTGNVTIYTGPKLATMLVKTPVLTDNDPASGEGYGTVVAALPFCATAPCATTPLLPLVGAQTRAFVYFTLGPTDPRAK